jgi:hypothetical protein
MVNTALSGYPVHMDKDSIIPRPLQILEGVQSSYSAHWLTPYHLGQLLLVKTVNKDCEAILELITQWILRGSFYLIAAGEWLPSHDDLRCSVYRYTVAMDEVLDHLILARPFTCLQLLDLLTEADKQNKPVLIIDVLHLFYNPDVDLSLRYSTLEKCCQYIRRLSFSNPVAVLVPDVEIEEYRRFFPFVASIADEIIETGKRTAIEAVQGLLF